MQSDLLICFGAAILTSAGGCLAVYLLGMRRTRSLNQEIRRISEDLLQAVELQAEIYRRVCSNISDIEGKVVELSVPSSDGSLPLERRHQVLTLARKGLSAVEIARRLHMPKGEAELLLSLRKYADPGSPAPSGQLEIKAYARG